MSARTLAAERGPVRTIVAAMVVMAAVAVVVACDGSPRPAPKAARGPLVLRVEGSTSLYPAISKMAARFEEQHPEMEVLLGRSSSSEGLAMLIHGTVDVAASSRPPTPQELVRAQQQGVVLKPYQVGYDAIAVIVHPQRSAAVSALSLGQVRDIFLDGSLRDWSQLGGDAPAPAGDASAPAGAPGQGPIHVYVRSPAQSGTAQVFVKLLADDWQTPFIAGARIIAGHDDLVTAVAEDPDGIGFAPIGLVDGRVRVVALSSDGRRFIVPSPHSIRDLSYPLRRSLYLVTRGTPRGAVNRLLRFALGPEGQAALATAGVLAMR